jgi:O-acetyl-ADP-ribose deacetylase (regulator of RNase III)
MIKYIDGDLLKFSDEGIFDVIAHCCNCFCNFAATVLHTK